MIIKFHFRKLLIALVLIVLWVVVDGGNLQCQIPYNIKLFEAPGAAPNNTFVTAISKGAVAGIYNDTNGLTHGFFYDGSQWIALEKILPTSLSFPKVIGQLITTNAGYQSAIFKKGSVSVFNPLFTGGIRLATNVASGISSNSVVGTYIDKNGKQNAYYYNGKIAVNLDNPLSTFKVANITVFSGITVPTAIDGKNIVGYFNFAGSTTGSKHGFLSSGGTNWIVLDCPLGSETLPTGISGNNIVGTYKDTNGVTRGFYFDGTDWSTVDDLLGDVSIGTIPTGIDGITIVGTYTDTNSLVHSFELYPLLLGGSLPPLSPQNITLDTNTLPTSVNYGSAPLVIDAKASSGLPVTFTSSNPKVAAVSSSNTIVITGVGKTVITVSADGDSSYLAATPIIQTLSVTKGLQTINYTTPPPTNIAFAKGQTFPLAATSTSGLNVAFKSSRANVISVAGGTATIKGLGSAVISAVQSGNKNWFAAKTITNLVTVSTNVVTSP